MGNEEKLEEMEKEIIARSKERENIEVEMEEKMKDICMREKESSEMIKQRDAKIEEQVEAMNTLKNQNTSLKNEISDMGVDLESARAGLQKEKLKNEMKDSTIEELNEMLYFFFPN